MQSLAKTMLLCLWPAAAMLATVSADHTQRGAGTGTGESTTSCSCLTWHAGSSSGVISSSWTPGRQGNRPLGVCRFATAAPYAPTGMEVGKLEGSLCYFTAQGAGIAQGKNGTAKSGYEVASLAAGEHVAWADMGSHGDGLHNAAVVGSLSDGVQLGVCLAPDGEGAGSMIVGKVFLNGPREAECCWSASFKEHCMRVKYSYATCAKGPAPPSPPSTPAPTPTPRPPVPSEPTPPLLEPKGGVFSGVLSFGANNSIMGLTFATPNRTLNRYNPVVRWSEVGTGGGGSKVGGRSTPQQAACTSSLNRSCYSESPVMHYCNMTGLAPSTMYAYSFGDEAIGMTPEYRFVSAPAVGDMRPQRIVVYGDMGLDYSENTRAMMARWASGAAGQSNEYDWVIHNGDISYADNHIGSRNKPGVDPAIYNDWMDTFYGNISAYATLKPYMLAPGNHEGPCNYIEYEARAAHMPHWASRSADVQVYSYTVGRVHVVSLSGEQGRFGSILSKEVEWLRRDLEAAAAARARGEIDWILTHVHYPTNPTGYCSSMMGYCCAEGKVGLRSAPEGSERWRSLDDAGDTAAVNSSKQGTLCVDKFMSDTAKHVEDMFVQYHVDIHITAHQHVYERTSPVYRYKAYGNGSEPFPAGHPADVFVAPKYPINVNNGNPGDVELQDVWMPPAPWSVGGRFNSDGSGGTSSTNYTEFGVVRFTTRPQSKALLVEFVSSLNGSTLDQFTVYK